MSHPTDGELRALLDREVSAEERSHVLRHLEECEECRTRRGELLRAEATVHEALPALTPPSGADVSAARRSVERRLRSAKLEAAERAGARGGDRTRRAADRRRSAAGWGGRGALARAAAVALLLVGGVAAGLPGSPVRQWLGELWGPDSGQETTAPIVSPAQVEEAGEAEQADAEIRVDPAAGSVRIVLTDAEPGTRVRITVVDRGSAGVVAGAGAGFRSGPGRMEVTGAAGEVRVEIPRSADDARVTANGRVLFRKEGSTVTLPSSDPDTAGAELLFQVPAGG